MLRTSAAVAVRVLFVATIGFGAVDDGYAACRETYTLDRLNGAYEWNTAPWHAASGAGQIPGSAPDDCVTLSGSGFSVSLNAPLAHPLEKIALTSYFTSCIGLLHYTDGPGLILNAPLITGSLSMDAGLLTGGGDLLITGGSAWSGGTMSGRGRTIVGSGGWLSLGGQPLTPVLCRCAPWPFICPHPYPWPDLVLSQRRLSNNGDIGLFGVYPLIMGDGAVLSNEATGVVDVGQSLTSTGDASIRNAGVLRLVGCNGIAPPVINSGKVFVGACFDGSRADTISDYVQTSGSTTIGMPEREPAWNRGVLASNRMIISGGRLEGKGVIKGSVSIAGTLAPGFTDSPGDLTITGDLVQTAGEMKFRIGGTSDRLVVGGAFRMHGGCLRASAAEGFVAAAGSVFDIITFGSREGSFDTVEASGLDVAYTPSTIRLIPGGRAATAVPMLSAPAVVALFFALLLTALAASRSH